MLHAAANNFDLLLAHHGMSLQTACRSMPRTLAAAVNSGWAVVGAAAEAGAVQLSEFKVDKPTVLVMGECVSRLSLGYQRGGCCCVC